MDDPPGPSTDSSVYIPTGGKYSEEMNIDDPPGSSTDSPVYIPMKGTYSQKNNIYDPSNEPMESTDPPVNMVLINSERKQYLYEQLKLKVQESFLANKEQISDDLLQNLSKSLADKTVMNILVLLRLQQKRKENELLNQRGQQISKLDAKRNERIRHIEKQFALSEITANQRAEFKQELKKQYDEKVMEIDMDILHELDQKVFDQQQKLSAAQIPGFFTTTDSEEISIQCELLNIIAQIDGLCDESKVKY